MREYNKYLKEQFGKLEINLVQHSTSPTGYPACIVVSLPKMPKDKGTFAKDLSNYIYRTTGLRYEYMPEYQGRGKNTTIRWFMSWEHLEGIKSNIAKALGCSEVVAPLKLQSLSIQGSK
jgi:hypothetical protein